MPSMCLECGQVLTGVERYCGECGAPTPVDHQTPTAETGDAVSAPAPSSVPAPAEGSSDPLELVLRKEEQQRFRVALQDLLDHLVGAFKQRPERYASVAQWMVAGAKRYPRACLVTFGLVYVLPAVAATLLGAVSEAGASIGLTVLVEYTLVGVPLAIVIALWTILREGRRLRLGGARRMSLREQDQIMDALEHCATELSIGRLPLIMVSDSKEPETAGNAFSATRHIIVSREVLRRSATQQGDVLRGVLAHELAHWYYADALGSTLVRALGWPLIAPYNFYLRLARYGTLIGQGGSSAGRAAGGIASFIAKIYAIPIKYVILPPLMADSRMVEYSCDQSAVVVGEEARLGLVTWLEEATWSEGAPTGWDQVVHASHPPSELRLEALETPDQMDSHPSLTDERLVPHAQVSVEHVGVRERIWG